jgi:hypothetical protein
MTKYSDRFIDEHRHINVEYDWWDSVYDDFSQICEILGIKLDAKEPSFSGFWSQGDGASWTGRYRAQGLNYKGLAPLYTYDLAPAKIREYCSDEELHRIADELCLLARIYRPVYAVVGRPHGSNYVHSSTMFVTEWEFYDEYEDANTPMEITEHVESTLQELFRDLAEWLYNTLKQEYEHLTSDEAVIESLEANEIEEGELECLD